MQYRKFGKLDWKVSALGFGAMRLPTLDGDHTTIDELEATRMLHYAIDHGVNYIDTGWMYHGGNSERFLGKALQGGYREKVKLATKVHAHTVEAFGDFDKILNKQLERLQTDHIDVYLLHGLMQASWHKVRDMDVLHWAEGAIADGRIGHLGFSFHDPFETLLEIIDAYDHWVMCQFMYNFMYENTEAGTKGIEYAAQKGLAVVIMEPLLGGNLATPPSAVQALWDNAQKNPVETALRWIWNKPEVTTVLSGMSTFEQVRQNVGYAASSGIGNFTQNDHDLIARVRETYNAYETIPCTKCRYCMPCPSGVDIPRNFQMYNHFTVYNRLERAQYFFLPEEQRAGACVACRACEDMCPQKILISEWMPRIHEKLYQEDLGKRIANWKDL